MRFLSLRDASLFLFFHKGSVQQYVPDILQRERALFPQYLSHARWLLPLHLGDSHLSNRNLRQTLHQRADILGDPVSRAPHRLLGCGLRVKDADREHLVVSDLQDIIGLTPG